MWCSYLAKNIVNDVITNLELTNKAIEVSHVRNMINEKLDIIGLQGDISNRVVKKMLIEHFGEKICFSYPYEKIKVNCFS